MSILIYALIVLLVAAIAIAVIRRALPEYADIASLVVFLIAVLVIVQRAGFLV